MHEVFGDAIVARSAHGGAEIAAFFAPERSLRENLFCAESVVVFSCRRCAD